ncbi:MAG: amidohydrolase [Chloroflexi bacterium]|nr:amidohydrolase [Chloroflexota bacterium]
MSATEERWHVAFNGEVFTMDEHRPLAQALAARDGRIVHVGTNEEVLRLAKGRPNCATFDLGGHCVLPGFTDSHIHFLSLGLNLEHVALAGVTSLEVVLERVGAAARAAAPGEWVLGWGWDHSLWQERRFPDRGLLDRVAPEVPVALRRKDGHMMWLNSAALAGAGIDRQTPDPAAGRIGRDAAGEPDGLLFERAMELAQRVIPETSEAQAERAARRAMAELHELGVTGVHIPEGAQTFGTLQRLDARGELRLRATMMLTFDELDAALATGLRSGFGSDRLRVGPMKVFVDGSLGSETAAMLAPFEGSEDNYGILMVAPDAVREAIARASAGGIACAVHAIGDRANRMVLDAFEATREVWQPAGLRPRIEHVQVLHPDDLPCLARLGIIASMQPIHATQDMDLVDRLWGRRGRYAYAFRSLLESGATLAFGSDAPVETADPLAGMYAAVARRRPDGTPLGGWYPEERIAVEDALRAYTTGAAYAAGMEQYTGSLTPGKRADFVVLSHNVLDRAPETILEAQVLQTVFDGEVVYSS